MGAKYIVYTSMSVGCRECSFCSVCKPCEIDQRAHRLEPTQSLCRAGPKAIKSTREYAPTFLCRERLQRITLLITAR